MLKKEQANAETKDCTTSYSPIALACLLGIVILVGPSSSAPVERFTFARSVCGFFDL